MDDREWALWSAEFEASFRGDFAEDRELAMREHVGDASLDEGREAIRALVGSGYVMVPAPAEVLGALRDVRAAARRALPRAATVKVGEGWKPHADVHGGAGCAGLLVVTFNDGRAPALVECDRCGAEFGVPQARAVSPAMREPTSAEDAAIRRSATFDDIPL